MSKRRGEELEEGEVSTDNSSNFKKTRNLMSSKLYRKDDTADGRKQTNERCAFTVNRSLVVSRESLENCCDLISSLHDCVIKFDYKESLPSQKKFGVVINGKSKRIVQRCKRELLAKIQSRTQLGPGVLESLCTVPDNKVGVIIGKNGSTLKRIMTCSDCKIFIPKEADPNSKPKTRTLNIAGKSASIPYCVKLISECIHGKSEAILPSGSAGERERETENTSRQSSGSQFKYTRSQWQKWKEYYNSQGQELQKEAPIDQRVENYYNT